MDHMRNQNEIPRLLLPKSLTTNCCCSSQPTRIFISLLLKTNVLTGLSLIKPKYGFISAGNLAPFSLAVDKFHFIKTGR